MRRTNSGEILIMKEKLRNILKELLEIMEADEEVEDEINVELFGIFLRVRSLIKKL
jgi:hypothetical protein